MRSRWWILSTGGAARDSLSSFSASPSSTNASGLSVISLCGSVARGRISSLRAGQRIQPRRAAARPERTRSRSVGYHATSTDGLGFTRQADVRLDAALRWLGNAQSEANVLRFFGTGGPRGVWTATSTNGQSWKVDEAFPSVPGADPGAVKLKDGGWLLAITGPRVRCDNELVPAATSNRRRLPRS